MILILYSTVVAAIFQIFLSLSIFAYFTYFDKNSRAYSSVIKTKRDVSPVPLYILGTIFAKIGSLLQKGRYTPADISTFSWNKVVAFSYLPRISRFASFIPLNRARSNVLRGAGLIIQLRDAAWGYGQPPPPALYSRIAESMGIDAREPRQTLGSPRVGTRTSVK